MKMQKKVTASAPGKLVLLGDHAVVYDRPCLVAAVEHRLSVSIVTTDKMELHIRAPEVQLTEYHKPLHQLTRGTVPKQAEYIEYMVKSFLALHQTAHGLIVDTSSQLDNRFGFGSSGATLAAVAAALNEFFGTQFERSKLFKLAYQVIHDVKGVGSGCDVAASLQGTIIYFVTGGKTIEPVQYSNLTLLAVYSGKKTDTPTIVHEVAALRSQKSEKVDELFDTSTAIVKRGRQALEHGDAAMFGECMNENHNILQELGVSTPELDRICALANKYGAYGAKLSGAGGGDCAIVATNQKEIGNLQTMYRHEGFESVEVKIAHQGVLVE